MFEFLAALVLAFSMAAAPGDPPLPGGGFGDPPPPGGGAASASPSVIQDGHGSTQAAEDIPIIPPLSGR